MKNVIKTLAIGSLAVIALQTFAQEHGRGDTVLTKKAFRDGVTTVDSLDIDTDIKVNGGVYMQRGANGTIGSVTLNVLDAAELEVDQHVRVVGDTHLGEESNLYEGSVHLTGDMGSADIDSKYKRKGKVVVGADSNLNVGSIAVTR